MMMMSPEQPAPSPAALSPGQLPQTMSPDLEEAWMELLTLPELQVLHTYSTIPKE